MEGSWQWAGQVGDKPVLVTIDLSAPNPHHRVLRYTLDSHQPLQTDTRMPDISILRDNPAAQASAKSCRKTLAQNSAQTVTRSRTKEMVNPFRNCTLIVWTHNNNPIQGSSCWFNGR